MQKIFHTYIWVSFLLHNKITKALWLKTVTVHHVTWFCGLDGKFLKLSWAHGGDWIQLEACSLLYLMGSVHHWLEFHDSSYSPIHSTGFLAGNSTAFKKDQDGNCKSIKDFTFICSNLFIKLSQRPAYVKDVWKSISSWDVMRNIADMIFNLPYHISDNTYPDMQLHKMNRYLL
jgi:hypothetical protein